MSTNEQNTKAEIESNPIGNELQFELSIPEKIEIKMVDASSLNDYELWGVIASVFCNFLVGFLVASISNTEEKCTSLYWSITGIFAIFCISSVIMVWLKRKQMTIKKKVIKMGVTKNG